MSSLLQSLGIREKPQHDKAPEPIKETVKFEEVKKPSALSKSKTIPKRHVNPAKPKAHISKPSLKRLARRGGVKRINKGTLDEAREKLRGKLTTVVGEAIQYAMLSNRKTITEFDVMRALERNNLKIYR